MHCLQVYQLLLRFVTPIFSIKKMMMINQPNLVGLAALLPFNRKKFDVSLVQLKIFFIHVL